jgi:hypothetical protein
MGNAQGSAGQVRALLAAVGAVGVVLAGVVPGIAAASSVVSTERLAATITCGALDVDGDSVFGQECDSEQWGPMQDFTIGNRDGEVFYCETGWAEGSQWVRGNDCHPQSW